MSSSLAAGAWIAALLAGIITPSSSGERALIGVVAIAAVIAVALLHVRTLRPAWSSAPSVIRHIRPSARARLRRAAAGAAEPDGFLNLSLT